MRSITRRFAAAAVLLAISSIAIAQQAPGVPKPADAESSLSIAVLASILGQWGSGEVNPVLSEAFRLLNLAVASFGALVFAFWAVVGSMASAHSGQVLGEKWSSMWAPARFTLAAIALMPTIDGVSVVQYGVMHAIGASVRIADDAWKSSVDYLIGSQSRLVALRLDDDGGVHETMYAILGAQICRADRNRMYRKIGSDTRIEITSPATVASMLDRAGKSLGVGSIGGGGGDLAWGYASGPFQGGTLDECGRISFPSVLAEYNSTGGFGAVSGAIGAAWSGVREGAARVQRVQRASVIAAAIQLDWVADRIVKASYGESEAPSPQVIGEAINRAADTYQAVVGLAAQQHLAAQNAPITGAIAADAKANGWITAGSWYYSMARLSSELGNAVDWAPRVTAPLVNNDDHRYGGMNERTYHLAAGLLSKVREYRRERLSVKVAAQDTRSTDGGISGGLDNLSNAALGAHGAAGGLAKLIGLDPESGVDPIVQLKMSGDRLITIAELGMAAKVASDRIPVGKLATVITSIKGRLLGDDGSGSVFTIAMSALLLVGFLLSVVLPIMPFVIWIIAVLGWVLGALQMIIAAPLWAATHIHPDGNDISSEHAKSGYFVALEVLMTPVMLVIGLLVAGQVSRVMLEFVSGAFFNAADAALSDSMTGLISMIGVIGIYFVICWLIINMSFKIVTGLPSGVMSMIGGSRAKALT